jgi:adenylate cyclase
MNSENLFDQKNILDLSFFNFRNAITAAFYANKKFEILRINKNFVDFFPGLGNVTNTYFPDVLLQLGIPGQQIEIFITDLEQMGSVLISEVHITVDGEDRVYSLLSTCTKDPNFSYLNGIQGQFADRTAEWKLKKERKVLLEQKIRDREIIEQKSIQLEGLATRLAKYLSPQIYDSIFSETEDKSHTHLRKNLTIFFSDIVQFTDLTDTLEPERLAVVINSYLSEMSTIAINCGGTVDKFIGDAILVFFGDPETEGDFEDALRCVELAIQMKTRAAELQKFWKRTGVPNGLHVRMGIATGYCTVGNFGSDQRLDYTVLGSPVNLAARLQSTAKEDTILIDENTHNLIENKIQCEHKGETIPKGFVRTLNYYEVIDFLSEEHRLQRRHLSHIGEHVEVNVIDGSNVRAAISELHKIQIDFEQQLAGSRTSQDKNDQ